MVPSVRRVRVQLHDTYQPQHRHSRHDHGEEPRSEYTVVWQFDGRFKFDRWKRFRCQKSNSQISLSRAWWRWRDTQLVCNGDHWYYCYFRQISSGTTVNVPAYLDRFIGCTGCYSYLEGCSHDNSVLSAYLASAICSCSSCPCWCRSSPGGT